VRIYNYYKKFDMRRRSWARAFAKSSKSSTWLSGSAHHQSELLAQLAAREGEVARALDSARAKTLDLAPIQLDEKGYRWMHNEDAMAVEKLSEGIRQFNARRAQAGGLCPAEVPRGVVASSKPFHDQVPQPMGAIGGGRGRGHFRGRALAGVITVGHGHGHDLLRLSRDCSDAYSAPATPKIIPAPLLAGAMVEPRSPSHFGPTRCEGNPLPCAG